LLLLDQLPLPTVAMLPLPTVAMLLDQLPLPPPPTT
jgi:hypothetical protein